MEDWGIGNSAKAYANSFTPLPLSFLSFLKYVWFFFGLGHRCLVGGLWKKGEGGVLQSRVTPVVARGQVANEPLLRQVLELGLQDRLVFRRDVGRPRTQSTAEWVRLNISGNRRTGPPAKSHDGGDAPPHEREQFITRIECSENLSLFSMIPSRCLSLSLSPCLSLSLFLHF